LEPVGSERLKVCELFAELIHLQYLFTSSPLFEGLVQDYSIPVPAPASPLSATVDPETPATIKESTENFATTPPPFRVIDGLIQITEQLVERHIFKICFVILLLQVSL
jgi:hypothetical protein